MRERVGLGIGLSLVALACGGGVKHEPETAASPPLSDGRSGSERAGYHPPPMRTEGAPAGAPSSALAAPPAANAASNDAPEISRSVGVAGGVVVLWPRIVQPHGSPPPDALLRQLAARVQSELARIARQGGAQVDVRPEPERVCPRSGCQATRVGALVARAGGGCAVIAFVGRPGASPSRLVPWAGRVSLSSAEVPFRAPPEQAARVSDYVPCDALDLSAHAAEVEAALRAAR